MSVNVVRGAHSSGGTFGCSPVGQVQHFGQAGSLRRRRASVREPWGPCPQKVPSECQLQQGQVAAVAGPKRPAPTATRPRPLAFAPSFPRSRRRQEAAARRCFAAPTKEGTNIMTHTVTGIVTTPDAHHHDHLANLLALSARQSPYFSKDLAKARSATQFIGQGSPGSSTAAYAKAASSLANTGAYTREDVVFVSAEGSRSSRFNPIGSTPNGAYRNLSLAIAARATFVIDKPHDRNRPYNVGERQIATYLTAHGYQETAPGRFTHDRD